MQVKQLATTGGSMCNKKPFCRISWITIFTSLWMLTIQPMLVGCGGSGSSSEDSETHLAVTAPATSTTDASGLATITSNNIAKEIQLTVTNSAGQTVEGLNVEYSDTSEGEAGHIIISDPNEIYQTTFVMFDTADLSTEDAANIIAITENGAVVDKSITITAAIIYVVLTALTAKAVYEIGTGLYKIYGNPPTVSLMGSYSFLCASTDQILTLMNIGVNAVGLITAGSTSAAAAGYAEGSKTAWEAFGKDLAVDGASTVGASFGSYLSDELGYESDQEYCIMLVGDAGQSDRYQSAADLASRTCDTAADCGSDSSFSTTDGWIHIHSDSGATSFEDIQINWDILDGDGDHYTVVAGDCNDFNPLISPGHLEICGDEIDQDCDGSDMECAGNIEVDIFSPPKTENCPSDMLIDGVCGGDTRGLTVMASVTGGTNTQAYIIVNGRAIPAEVESGIVSSNNPALLKCESDGWVNKIQVAAIDQYGDAGIDEMDWNCNASPTDMLIMLTWDTCDTDLDLYVQEPSGAVQTNDAFWAGGSETALSGVVYGYETNCYGPVYYAILEGAPAGTYAMRVHHNSGSESPTATLRIINDESFDSPYTVTRTVGRSSSSASGRDNFSSTDESWSEELCVEKSSYGYWMSVYCP